MKNHSDLPTLVCRHTHLAVRDAIDDLTSAPELKDLRPYRELCNQLYLAAIAAGDLANWLGDKETADCVLKAADQLGRLADM